MAKKISDDGMERKLEALFPVDGGLPCPVGATLLRAFSEARPADLPYLKPSDLVDLRNSAFAAIPEWEAFSEHYGSCEHCNA
jgi:hypothetical protein